MASSAHFNPDDPFELAAARMTRFLASTPWHRKTRAYLATLPKRGKITVSPDDYPLVVRADANRDYKLQLIRDAQRYADWERRGKPPSPSAPPRKDRMRPRAKGGRDPLRQRLYTAQGGNCGLCSEPLFDPRASTIDHVVPRALGGRNASNLLLAHSLCNTAKADRPPTQRELEALAAVNDALRDSDTRPKAGDGT